MVYGSSMYGSELLRINGLIRHHENNIKAIEKKIKNLEGVLRGVKKEYKKLEKHADNFKTKLCKVEDWQGTRYENHVGKVDEIAEILRDYKGEIEEAMTSIKEEIERLEEEIDAERAKIRGLVSEQSKLRREVEKENALRNPCGSGTY